MRLRACSGCRRFTGDLAIDAAELYADGDRQHEQILWLVTTLLIDCPKRGTRLPAMARTSGQPPGTWPGLLSTLPGAP